MKKFTTFICIALFSFFIGCTSKPVEVYPVNTLLENNQKLLTNLANDKENGIFFNLPRNGIELKINVDQTKLVAGPYSDLLLFAHTYQDAKRIYKVYKNENNSTAQDIVTEWNKIKDKGKEIGIEDNENLLKVLTNYQNATGNNAIKFVNQNATIYKIKDGSLGVVAEPDPSKVYFAKFPNEKFEDEHFKFTLNQHGTVTGSENSSNNKRIDFAITTTKIIVDIAVSALTYGVMFFENLPIDLPQNNDLIEMDTLYKKLGRIKKNINKNTYENLKKDIDSYIAWNTDGKRWVDNMLEGNIKDINTYTEAQKYISNKKKVIENKFYGKKTTHSKTISALVIPQSILKNGTIANMQNGTIEYPIFNYSKNGIYDYDKYITNMPYNATDFDDGRRGKEKTLTLKIEVNSNLLDSYANSTKDIKLISDKLEKELPYGMPYNIPKTVIISLVDKWEKINKSKHVTIKVKSERKLSEPQKAQIAQLGITRYMPYEINGKTSNYSISYFADTGGLNIIDMSTTGQDPATVQAVSDSINSALKLEATRLTNEAAIAQAKLSIKTSEKALKDFENSSDSAE